MSRSEGEKKREILHFVESRGGKGHPPVREERGKKRGEEERGEPPPFRRQGTPHLC